MSGYSNGQPYYHSNSYNGQYHNNSYTIANSGQSGPHRRSSYDAGDDTSHVDQGQGQSQAQHYNYGQSAYTQAQPYGTQNAHPYRNQVQSQLGGYQHQSQSIPAAQGSYNPAQYPPQNTYAPQTYGSPQMNSYSMAGYPSQSNYQPYVPAAYGEQSVNRSASVYNSLHATSPQNAYNTAPPPPPRAGERSHSSQALAQSYPSYPPDVSPSYPYQSNSYLAMPSPPAPAPPPHQDPSHAARPYSHSATSHDPFHDAYAYRDGASTLSSHASDVIRNHSSASRNSNLSNQFASSPQLSGTERPKPASITEQQSLRSTPTRLDITGLASESESDSERYGASSGTLTGYDDLMYSLDAAIGTTQSNSFSIPAQRDPLFAPASPELALSPDEPPTHNGIITTGNHNINYGAFANDSDAEAAAGLAAMQAADEQEAAEEARRQSSHFSGTMHSSDRERSDDSDYAGYGDLSLAGGGYAATMHYGDDIPTVTNTQYNYSDDQFNQRMSSMRSSGVSSDAQSSGYEYASGDLQPFPTLQPQMAQVDAGGTGGLTEPSPHPRRLSYEDGDETASFDYGDGGDGIPDLFFHPGMSPNRPLPPPPARSGSDSGSRAPQHLTASSLHQNRYSAYDNVPRLYPPGPDAYNEALNPSLVPRSTSLVSNRSQPRHEQPMRSKTDAEARARMLKQQAVHRATSDGYDVATPKSDVGVGSLDLPAIPRKKFDPSKITTDTFKRCSEPWAMSSVYSWIRSLTDEETDLKENTLSDAISALFCNKVPTISTIEADALAQQFVHDMFTSRVLHKDEEWVKFAPGTMSGVMYQLTGLGCYSSKLHLQEGLKGRCYSHLCMRTIKKADFTIPVSVKETPFIEFWGLTKEQIEPKGKKEIERQFNMREMVYSEEGYLFGLEILRTLYRDRLAKAGVAIVPAKRLPVFLNDVFGLAVKCQKVNEEYLAPQLKYRENEQGPWVVGYSDILREWIRRARPVYVDYAAKFPKADKLVREEMVRNPTFVAFLDSARKEPISGRHGWDNWLKSPIQRLQRLILQLETIMKNTPQASEEKTGLAFAIDEIKATAHEMDVRVNEVNKQLELADLAKKFRLRKHPGDEVDLALDHLGRTIVLRGDMMRQGGKGVSWVQCHAILFDHYLVLAKPGRDVQGNELFDVSKPPIHMGLISLESTNDAAVQRSAVRGTTVVAQSSAAKSSDPRLARTTSSQSGSTLQHTNTGMTGGSSGSGAASIITSTVLEDNSKDDKIYYPFKVKHLGRTEVYTLYATTPEKRQEWCEAIISAKTQHAEALHAQNAEPFKLRVLADTAFGSDNYTFGSRRTIIRGTPLDRAIREVEKKYSGTGRPAPISRTSVNCATVFQQPAGRTMCAIGTDGGVYISEYQNPRGWVRVIQMSRVTQIAVLEEFNLLIILTDKVLIAYHLDVVCPQNGPPMPQTNTSIQKAPQRLSGSKDVGFFVAGKMRDRVLVFYQKKDGIHSIFKILEPVLQKSATSKSRWLGNSSRRGQTEFFREYDEFYIPAETYGLNMFHSSLAVATKRGMEVLTLDKKITWGVPNLDTDPRDEKDTKTRLDSIAQRLKDVRPLGMFRLSEAEFLVTFSECAVYVNKLGDISRSVIMEFVGRANHACLSYPYLILFNDDFVEIRDAQNGRMKQVIAGKDIRMLDDGGNQQPGTGQREASLGGGTNGLGMQGFHSAPRTVKFALQNPELDKCYIVVEMIMRTEQQ